MMRALAVASALSLTLACGESNPRLEPTLDLPPEGSGADPFGGIDSLQLSIARAGAGSALVERTITIPEPLTLGDIPFGEDLVLHLSGLSNGGEVAYGRSCAFSVDGDGASVAAPHIYFARIVKWGPGAVPMEPTRTSAASYVLPDGSAIFASGTNSTSSEALTGIERFDPLESGAFEAVGEPLIARTGSVLAALPDGRALVIGGLDSAADAVATVELLSPLRSPVLEAIDGPRLHGHAAITLVDGTVLATGGRSQSQAGGAFTVAADAWSFAFGAGDVLDAPRQLPVGLSAPRADHTMTRLGSEVGADVIVIGGRDDTDTPLAESELFRPLAESFEAIPNGQLNVPRWNHKAIRLPGGFILVVGGITPDGAGGTTPVAELEVYDPVQGRFKLARTLPAAAGLTELSATSLPDGRVLLAGGRDIAGNAVDTVLIARLDPINGQVDVSVTNALSTPRANHAAEVLCDGTVLVVGGTDLAGQPAERYNPPSADRR